MILDELVAERARQDRAWGEQNHADGLDPLLGELLEREARRELHRPGRVSWSAILLEEVGEALRAPTDEALRGELVQVAAVVVAWLEALDRRVEPRTGDR